MVEKKAENPLIPLGVLDKVYMQQICEKAFALQYGRLVVEFKVRGGEVKEAHVIQESKKLRPF